jgi:hypothetical protein
MHFINYSTNQGSPRFIFNDSERYLAKGQQQSLAEFFKTMKTMGLPAQQYWQSIKDIAVKTLITGLPWLKKEYEVAQPSNEGNNMCF